MPSRKPTQRTRDTYEPGNPGETRRSPCPIACALDLLGDKWSLLVVRDMMRGKAHFKDFVDSPEGIATNILSQRLARMCAHGLIERYPSVELPGREAYRLTVKGTSLLPVLEQLAAWGLENIEGTAARLRVVKLPTRTRKSA